MIMLFLNLDPLMRNTYGFYRGGAEPLSTETFLVQNTLGLAGLFGISASFADVALTPLSNQVSVMVGTRHCPLKNQGTVVGEGKTLVVRYNANIIAKYVRFASEQKVPVHIPFLWSQIGRALRLFTVTHLNLPKEELLPASLFRVLGLAETASAISEDYIQRHLSERDMRVEIDTSVIASYLAILLTFRALRDERVATDHIQDIIFETRRENAKDILLKVW